MNPGGDNATLLQITVIDPAPLDNDPPHTAAAKCLLQMIGGIERRRTEFAREVPTSLMFGGVSAAKLQWTGRLQQLETVGVMYCVRVGSQFVSLHTQDAGRQVTPSMKLAIDAIETIQIKADK
jgi:hypothetical protein